MKIGVRAMYAAPVPEPPATRGEAFNHRTPMTTYCTLCIRLTPKQAGRLVSQGKRVKMKVGVPRTEA